MKENISKEHMTNDPTITVPDSGAYGYVWASQTSFLEQK
jgi:hypothetical protein